MFNCHTQLMTALRVVAIVMALSGALALSSAQAASAANQQQAAQIALQQNGGGKVLGVTSETDGQGRRVFAVKILSNGRVRVVRIAQE